MTRRPLAILLALWAGALVVGFVPALEHELRPGKSAPSGRAWPAASALPAPKGEPRLVLFAHPGCPCTRASLTELEWIAARSGGRGEVFVVVVAPKDAPAGWAPGTNGALAAAIPGVSVLVDEGGREASLFGALSSGQTLAYDAQGSLAFRGGITGSRGHVGANAGREAALAILRGSRPETASTPVFGCAVSGGPAAAAR